jgi:hypothetical protein
VKNLLTGLFAISCLVACGGTSVPEAKTAIGLTPTITGQVANYTLGSGTITADFNGESGNSSDTTVGLTVGSIDVDGKFTINLPNLIGKKGNIVTTPDISDVKTLEARNFSIVDESTKAVKGKLDKGFNAKNRQLLVFATKNAAVKGIEAGTNYNFDLQFEQGWNWYTIDGKAFKSQILSIPWVIEAKN